MTELARKLRVNDYFSLGWGTMVGVGWLVVMDDWLLRGGTLGGVLGFAIGGLLLLPIGCVYGKLVTIMPDASGEVAYTAKVFPPIVSYATGWMMLLATSSFSRGKPLPSAALLVTFFRRLTRSSFTALPGSPSTYRTW